jgi:hypothetical protein
MNQASIVHHLVSEPLHGERNTRLVRGTAFVVGVRSPDVFVATTATAHRTVRRKTEALIYACFTRAI